MTCVPMDEEDCLYLNAGTPSNNWKTPVLFTAVAVYCRRWVEYRHDGESMARQHSMVTINYRLGI